MRATQQDQEVKTQKNKEFTTLIGRRLREAYVTSFRDVLPETIELRLALLRQAEARVRESASLDPAPDGSPAAADRSH